MDSLEKYNKIENKRFNVIFNYRKKRNKNNNKKKYLIIENVSFYSSIIYFVVYEKKLSNIILDRFKS